MIRQAQSDPGQSQHVFARTFRSLGQYFARSSRYRRTSSGNDDGSTTLTSAIVAAAFASAMDALFISRFAFAFAFAFATDA